MPKITSKTAEAKKEGWDRFSLTAPEGTKRADTLILDFWLQNCKRIVSVILSHAVCGPLLWHFQKTLAQPTLLVSLSTLQVSRLLGSTQRPAGACWEPCMCAAHSLPVDRVSVTPYYTGNGAKISFPGVPCLLCSPGLISHCSYAALGREEGLQNSSRRRCW